MSPHEEEKFSHQCLEPLWYNICSFVSTSTVHVLRVACERFFVPPFFAVTIRTRPFLFVSSFSDHNFMTSYRRPSSRLCPPSSLVVPDAEIVAPKRLDRQLRADASPKLASLPQTPRYLLCVDNVRVEQQTRIASETVLVGLSAR